MTLKIYSVTELNRHVQELLEETCPPLYVEGEISMPKLYPSGHLYFTLKDAESEIKAVRFNHQNRRPQFEIEHGLKIIAAGRVTLYAKKGQYQLIAETIEPAGLGALQLAYEQLKTKLAAEGLFEASRKRTLPPYPRRIGVITSPKGAVLHDILTILKRRAPQVSILFYPVPVQGEGAAPAIIEAIEALNREAPDLDALLVGRGGGSLEELWAFNEESVVRAIAASRIPTVTCIGHETDTTLSDLAADVRAPTPSAAAELVAASLAETAQTLAHLRHRLEQALQSRLRLLEEHLHRALRCRYLQDPLFLYKDRVQQVDQTAHRLQLALQRRLDTAETSLRHAVEKLGLLSPKTILGRGYAIVRDRAGRLLKDAKDVQPGDALRIDLARGQIGAAVTHIKPI